MILSELWNGASYEYAESSAADDPAVPAVITVTGISGKQFAVGMVKCSTEISGNVTLTIESGSTQLWKEFLCNTGSGVCSPGPTYFFFALRTTPGEDLVVTATPVVDVKAEVCLVYATLTTTT